MMAMENSLHYSPGVKMMAKMGLLEGERVTRYTKTNSSPLKMLVSNRNLQTSRGLFYFQGLLLC